MEMWPTDVATCLFVCCVFRCWQKQQQRWGQWQPLNTAVIVSNSQNIVLLSAFLPDQSELGLALTVESCLQVNLVYQQVVQEALEKLETLLRQNEKQQVRTVIVMWLTEGDSDTLILLPYWQMRLWTRVGLLFHIHRLGPSRRKCEDKKGNYQ